MTLNNLLVLRLKQLASLQIKWFISLKDFVSNRSFFFILLPALL